MRLTPPAAKRVPRTDVVHGDVRHDDYHWMRQKDDPEVTAYLTAENAYTDAVMKPTLAFQEGLYAEMLARIKEDDQTVPYRRGGFFYYSRTEKGKQYPILCRKAGSLAAPEQVMLDLNRLAEGHPFLALGAASVSDDGRRLAYTTDLTGFREYTLHVKDLETGALLPDQVEKVGAVAWAADNETLFYVTEDEAKRPYRLHRHRLGAAGADLLLEEPDALFRLHVGRSRSLAYLFLIAGSFTTTEVRYCPATDPEAAWRTILAREKDHEYQVDHGRGPEGDVFYIRTNGGKRRNFRLVVAPVDDPRPDRWRELIPHRDDVMLEDVEVFAQHYVVQEREDGLIRLRITDARAGTHHHVQFPEPTYDLDSDANAEFETGAYRLRYQSLITPASVFDYEIAGRRLLLLKQAPVLGGYDPAQYRSERIHATASDGTRIPISLVRHAETRTDGSSPMLLAGYGAYGFPYPAGFSSNRLSLLDRGLTVAIAHIRGGGEMGKRWHDEGRMMNKRNTFTDFIAAADFLAKSGYTAPDRLIIEGGSAGGLLMGAVLNLRPDCASAAILRVPFVDVINTMLDESLPLTVGEFEEWGNPKVREQYDYMKAYCPYTNLDARPYPALLVKTSLNDSQVMYWEPAKYVARMRAIGRAVVPPLFKVNMAAGHGGASGRYDYLREIAFDYAFILTHLARFLSKGPLPPPPDLSAGSA
ncbi:MAG TPA: S9 family peptidase [Candidatus Nitrosotalea sp.]|nr:S9 family peptidase [Candidatus Nitrosotalea sp.]